jgi:hypothetical protein
MGFKIISGIQDIEQFWLPIDMTAATQSLYVGQLVKMDTGSFNGAAPMAVASGAADTSNKQIVLGVVTGTNNYPMTELFNATYGQYITGAATQAAQLAIMKMGHAGNTAVGDPAPMVQIAKISPDTLIEAPLYNATYGVAPTLCTVTTGSSTGASMTTNATDVATVANMCTAFCRTGANAGLHRIAKSASSTTHTFDTYFPYAIAVGDTFVIVPIRLGTSYVQINSTSTYLGMCLNVAATPATNYFQVTVKDFYLSAAGQERVRFWFDPCHFSAR